jgi:hypothetical protein
MREDSIRSTSGAVVRSSRTDARRSPATGASGAVS